MLAICGSISYCDLSSQFPLISCSIMADRFLISGFPFSIWFCSKQCRRCNSSFLNLSWKQGLVSGIWSLQININRTSGLLDWFQPRVQSAIVHSHETFPPTGQTGFTEGYLLTVPIKGNKQFRRAIHSQEGNLHAFKFPDMFFKVGNRKKICLKHIGYILLS